MKFPTHLYDELRSVAAGCSGVSLATLLVMIPFYSEAEVAHDALLVAAWLGGFGVLLVVTNGIAFARQGGFHRAWPQLLGILVPSGVTCAYAAGWIPIVAWLATLGIMLPFWPVVFLYGYRITSRLDAAAKDSRALSTGWKLNYVGEDPTLPSVSKLLDVEVSIDPWRRGGISGCPTSFVSRVASFSVEAPPDGLGTLFANGLRAIIVGTLTKEAPEGPYCEFLARPVSWFAVELPDTASVVPDFRAVSRRRADRDIVFSNVVDRSERLESIDLDHNYSIRIPVGADRLRAWQVFSVSLIQRLNETPHLVVAKADDHLIVMRLHGCTTGADVDQLHAFTETLVTELVHIR